MDHLKEDLENYMAQYPKVKILRSKERVGLIGARMMGVRKATAPVLTFLDSHIECTPGWLEPLLDTIARSRYSYSYTFCTFYKHFLIDIINQPLL